MKKILIALLSAATLAGCSSTRHRDESPRMADHATVADNCGVGNFTFRHLKEPCAPKARATSDSEYLSSEDAIGTSESSVDFDEFRPENQIDLTQEVLFQRGSATLTRDAQETLDDVAWMIRENEDHIAQVNVEGHAMESATPARNLALSRARAQAVRTYLIRRGVDPSMLATQGYGETRPKFNASNASQDELERNERVDFTVETYND
jgi:outer membrane protein OmpA-like peptidoglycan-associated protein